MVLSDVELINCFNILEIELKGSSKVTLRQASKAFQKLALRTHPDKTGKESAGHFLKIREAYD